MQFYDFFNTIEFRLLFFAALRVSGDMIKIFRFNSNKSGLFVCHLLLLSANYYCMCGRQHCIPSRAKCEPKEHHNFQESRLRNCFYCDFFMTMMACHKIYDCYNVFICDYFTYFVQTFVFREKEEENEKRKNNKWSIENAKINIYLYDNGWVWFW